jgi:hypothetical protein
MTRVRSCFLAGAALALLAAGPARAQHIPKPPHGPDLLRAAQTAGLSPTQVAQIKKIAVAGERELIPLQAKLKLAQLDLQEAMDGDAVPAEKKVLGLIERVGQLETQVKKNRVLMMLRIRGTMGKAQWDKLQAAQHGPRPPLPPPPPSPPHP